MKHRYSPALVVTAISTLAACNVAIIAAETVPADSHLYQGFGDYRRGITTASPEAQKWFNQGLELQYGFNHDEAIRSFHAAAAIDPEAAMPWWGIAYANGISINDQEMTDERSKAAREAADNALARIEGATPQEAALIRAVSERYVYPAPEDRRSLDEAFATAMEKAYARFPNDPEIGTIYGDSLMNLQPWDYWDSEGHPKGRINEIVNVLEHVISYMPDHPGANHFYIHAVEASNDPDRAIAAADRMRSLVPGAGHLLHMPSHIYARVGRYNDAVDSNFSAIEADRAYFKLAPEPKFYLIYYAHNQHFLAYAAMMSGRYEDAIKVARELEAEMPKDNLKELAGMIEGIMPTTFHVLIRFGKWEQVLKEPAYAEDRLVSNAVRHYARSIAYSATGRTKQARKELEAFEKAMAVVPEDWYVFNNKVSQVLAIAEAMIHGELLYREGKYAEAFARLRKGIEAEDSLVYDEPPGWMLPVRHAMGALLVSRARFAEAEQVYREDLLRNRDNGWALIGLQSALMDQGKTADATALSRRIAMAWSKADTVPTSSCFCEPGEVVTR